LHADDAGHRLRRLGRLNFLLGFHCPLSLPDVRGAGY
jgi:hypothetical protein